VQACFDELSNTPHVMIRSGPARQEYGQIEFEIVDPNGYVPVFAQPAG
jgi:hypothetical protein